MKAISRILGLNFFAAALMLVGWIVASPAFGAQKIFGEGLLLSPTKVVFEGRSRSSTTLVLNKGEEIATYRIEMIPLLETDKGPDAKDWVRFSPRRTTLAPCYSACTRGGYC